MQHYPPTSDIVRLNLHLRRNHTNRLVVLADKLSHRKGRDVRLAEALDLALIAGLTWEDQDLLDVAHTDRDDPRWLLLGPVAPCKGGKALIPACLRGGR